VLRLLWYSWQSIDTKNTLPSIERASIVACLAGFAFSYFLVAETKGKTLEAFSAGFPQRDVSHQRVDSAPRITVAAPSDLRSSDFDNLRLQCLLGNRGSIKHQTLFDSATAYEQRKSASSARAIAGKLVYQNLEHLRLMRRVEYA